MTATKGKLILVVGSTGSGKGSLMRHIRDVHPELVYPISCTTRSMRPGEVEGREFFFLTQEQFEQRIQHGDFLEWAEYGGHYYGSLKENVIPYLAQGKTVIDELEVQGARQIQKIIPAEELAIIFIDAGPWSDLERRIRARAPIEEDELNKRKERYDDEMRFAKEATYIVKNVDGHLDDAKKTFTSLVESLIS
jgi:guanylate kinase